MTREEPRQRDWWLVGCAALAAILIAVDVASVVSDDVVARPAAEPQVHTAMIYVSGEARVDLAACGALESHTGLGLQGDCERAVEGARPSEWLPGARVTPGRTLAV